MIQEEPPSTLPPGAAIGGASGGAAGAGGANTSGGAPSAAGNSAGGSNSVGGASAGGFGNPSAGRGGQSTGGTGGAPTGTAGGPPVVTPPQFPSGTELLNDDFEAFDPADWGQSSGSIWAITTDAETGSTVYGQTETTASGRHLASAGDLTWTNVIVEADVKVIEFNGSSTSYMAGVCVRVSDAQNFYMIGVRSDGDVGLREFTNGSGSNGAAADVEDIVAGEQYRLRVEVNGSTITALLNGEPMFTHSDTTHTAGGVGLCTVRTSAVFDNILVTAP